MRISPFNPPARHSPPPPHSCPPLELTNILATEIRVSIARWYPRAGGLVLEFPCCLGSPRKNAVRGEKTKKGENAFCGKFYSQKKKKKKRQDLHLTPPGAGGTTERPMPYSDLHRGGNLPSLPTLLRSNQHSGRNSVAVTHGSVTRPRRLTRSSYRSRTYT